MSSDGAKEPQLAEVQWKLVETQSLQLAEAVAGARRPFFLALTWAFIWAAALYSVEYGFAGYLDRFYGKLFRLAQTIEAEEAKRKTAKIDDINQKDDKTPDRLDALEKALNDRSSKRKYEEAVTELANHCKGLQKLVGTLTQDQCRDLIRTKAARFEAAYYESTLISLPGGLGKFSVSDLGIIGQLGLLLILSWCFFASRRENHAVKAFVDIADNENSRRMFQSQYILRPKARLLLAMHLAYAYKSVAQRFVFLFSQHSRPLLMFTVLLATVPALVASLNAYTDMRDLAKLLPLRGSFLPIDVIVFQTILEAAMLVLVWVITYHIVRHDIETSLLLNGWKLAAEQVWLADWNTLKKEATSVTINVDAQTATAIDAPKGSASTGQDRGTKESGGTGEVPDGPK